MEKNGLQTAFLETLRDAGKDPDKIQRAAQELRQKILGAPAPEEWSSPIITAYREMGKDRIRVAVRSSATAEDLADASFAGQQETYLNVMGEEELLTMIRRCYASLWGRRAVAYRFNQGFEQAEVELAVVVQQMVESEKAGVLFTTNPVNNRKDEVAVNASYGLGESVVSGRVNADTYVCDKQGKLLRMTMGSKATEIVYDTEGTKEQPVAEERQKQQCLSQEELETLCREGGKIEKHYAMPMDIEWAIAGGKLFILQARAITTLGGEEEVIDEALVRGYTNRCKTSGMARKNLKFLLEKISQPVTPLDEYMVGAINNQKSVIFAEVGLEMSMQPQIDDDAIVILPSNKKKVNGNLKNFIPAVRQLKDFPLMYEKTKTAMSRYKEELEKIKAVDYAALSLKETGEAFFGIHDFVSQLAYDRFMYAMFPSYFANGKIKKVLKKADPDLNEFDLYANLDYRTAVISREVSHLAEEIRRDPGMTQKVLGGMKYEAFLQDFPQMREPFEKFLHEQGYKLDFNCFCLASRSYLDDPDRVLNIIRPLLTAEMKPEEDKYSLIKKKIRAVTDDALYEKTMQNIEYFRYFHCMREESQYYWETAFYYARKAARRMAELLFEDPDYDNNLIWLFPQELKELIALQKGVLTAGSDDEGKAVIPENFREKIERRKGNRRLANAVWDACKLKVFGEPSEVLTGISGSQGQVSGTARVILRPEEFYKMQAGDILVCEYTDPEWTPLFTMAKAVVADTGSTLSHAAIVAREYGIPAVLGVGFATRTFKDGDRICVDGIKGQVYREGDGH